MSARKEHGQLSIPQCHRGHKQKVPAALGVPTLEGSVPGLIFPKCCLAPGPRPHILRPRAESWQVLKPLALPQPV